MKYLIFILILIPTCASALSMEEQTAYHLCHEHWNNTRTEKYDVGFEKCEKIYPAILDKLNKDAEARQYQEDKKERDFIKKFSDENGY